MLCVTSSGRARTVADFEKIFAVVGLKIVQTHPTKGVDTIIEAVKA